MPIEIKELQIITVISDESANSAGAAAASAAVPATDKIIAACVEQVMQILEQKNER